MSCNDKNNKLALPTPKQMAIIDVEASKNNSLFQLMKNAGWAVAQEIIKHYKPCKTTILCGAGNNGGDGYIAAYFLSKAGWPINVVSYATPKPESEATKAAVLWGGQVKPFSEESLERSELVVDAIFGAGLSRPLDENVIDVLRSAKRIISIDIPSGIDGATGEILGYAPTAELTITFFRAKPGHFLLPARKYIGKLIIKDIGISADHLSKVGIKTWLNEPDLWHVPSSQLEDYKYSRGIVSVVGGSVMTGAGRLSALSAAALGAGLVRIFTNDQSQIYQMTAPCFIEDHGNISDFLHNPRQNIWVCGPGLTQSEVNKSLPILIKHHKKIVGDAGVFQDKNIHMLKGCSVLTPHIGEFKRVFGEITENKLQAVSDAAKLINSVIVLKGVDTIIASPDGRVAINNHANSRLATAGSGDILSGIIASLLAAGMDDWDAACAGVWIHGEAAMLCQHSWPTVMDIIANLGQARENCK